jgi:hypothetical protein
MSVVGDQMFEATLRTWWRTLWGRRSLLLVEGNIAAGKTTFLRALHANEPWATVEPEHVGADFLAAFYAAPGAYAFALQMTQLAHRRAALRHLAEAIVDRSVLGDYAFALWNAATGNLTPEQWRLYRSEAGASVAQALASSVAPAECAILFLNDAAETCRIRQVARDGTPIPIEYMRGIEAAHIIIMAHVPPEYTLVELRWPEYSTGQLALEPATASERRATLRARAEKCITLLDESDRTRSFLRDFLDSA